jgi:hypothetical protein
LSQKGYEAKLAIFLIKPNFLLFYTKTHFLMRQEVGLLGEKLNSWIFIFIFNSMPWLINPTEFKILKTNIIGLKFHTSQTCAGVLKISIKLKQEASHVAKSK